MHDSTLLEVIEYDLISLEIKVTLHLPELVHLWQLVDYRVS